MDANTRRRNQERWTSDEVRVLVGTIAFGLGINKPGVRAVIHLSLPKSIEQYYQEAGRAGRDGQPADCLLLWQKRDVALLTYFTEQINDPAEQERAWQRYRDIRGFAESRKCRHRQICTHFGEIPKWKSCAACDVCGGEPGWLSRVDEAQPTMRSKPAPPASWPARTRQAEPSRTVASTVGATEIDSELREYLREWRRAAAKQQGVPAFVVMHDTSLEELCRIRPGSLTELRRVYGFGERKTASYGRQILHALAEFRKGGRAAASPEKKPKPAEETIRLLAEGRTFEEIAQLRGRQLRTVVDLVAGLVEREELEFQPKWVDLEKQESIEAACARLGFDRLTPLKNALSPEITFEEIRLVVARLRRQRGFGT
jgi:ATP-dependent DNA helicase RecQ